MVGVSWASLVVKHLLVGSMLCLLLFVKACLHMNCTGARRIICHMQMYREKALNINH